MKAIKGCVNAACSAHKKKTVYKDAESFCSICGSPLEYVCKNCFTQLPDGKEKYCVRCKAERDDKTEHRKKALVAIGTGALTVVTVVATKGKKVFEFVNDVIQH